MNGWGRRTWENRADHRGASPPARAAPTPHRRPTREPLRAQVRSAVARAAIQQPQQEESVAGWRRHARRQMAEWAWVNRAATHGRRVARADHGLASGGGVGGLGEEEGWAGTGFGVAIGGETGPGRLRDGRPTAGLTAPVGVDDAEGRSGGAAETGGFGAAVGVGGAACARTYFSYAVCHADAAPRQPPPKGARRMSGGGAPFRIPARPGLTSLWVALPAKPHAIVPQASSRRVRPHAPQTAPRASMRRAAVPSSARATGRAASPSPPRRRAAAPQKGQTQELHRVARQEAWEPPQPLVRSSCR